MRQTKGPPRSGGDDPCTNTCTRSTNTNTSLTTLVIALAFVHEKISTGTEIAPALSSASNVSSEWVVQCVASRRLSRFVGDCHESAHWTIHGGNKKNDIKRMMS